MHARVDSGAACKACAVSVISDGLLVAETNGVFQQGHPQKLVGALTTLLGLLTLGTGVYFAALRPAMLPEDERLTGVNVESLPPAFTSWLAIVFRTWAGFTIAFGLLLITLGFFFRTSDSRWVRGGIATSVLIAFGSFLASNLQIGSDFVWFIALLFALAVCTSVAMLWPGMRKP